MKLLQLLIVAILLTSCSSVTVLRTREIQAVGDEVKLLRKDLVSLRENLDTLQQQQSRLQKRMKADMAMITSRVGEDYEKVIARMEENQYRLDLLIGKSDKILSKKVVIERRVSVNPTNPATTINSTSDSLGVTSANVSQPAVDTHVKTIYSDESDDAYNTAKADFHKAEYKLAYDGFKQVYEKKMGTPQGENALYWMGLCLLETKQRAKAIIVLDRVLTEYPSGTKTCVTHFRLSQMAKEDGDQAKMKEQLLSILNARQCSGTNEAMKASAVLKESP